MRRLLFVAHPDDEILWFNPYDFDKIVICFLSRDDKPEFDKKRLAVLNEHPLRDKIECLNICEDNALRAQVIENYLRKESQSFDLVFTHNSKGEYGHDHHLLIHSIVKKVCPKKLVGSLVDNTLSKEDWFIKIKNIYLKHGCWTWKK